MISKLSLLASLAFMQTAFGHGHHGHAHEILENNQSKLLMFLDKHVFFDNAIENTVLASFLILITPPILIQILPSRIVDPIMHSNKTVIFSFGSILGELFLHILPQLYASSQLSNEYEAENTILATAISIFVGYSMFFTLEKFILLVMNKFNGTEVEDGSSHHGHTHLHKGKEEVEMEVEYIKDGEVEEEKIATLRVLNTNDLSVYYLNMIADFTHSLSDGILLSSSFKTSKQIGISTTVAILIHEIPHIMGDYALLNQKMGFTYFQCFKQQVFGGFGRLFGLAFNYFIFTQNKHVLQSNATKIPTALVEPSLVEKVQELIYKLFGVSKPVVSVTSSIDNYSGFSFTNPKVFNIVYSSFVFQKLPETWQSKIISFTNFNILKYNEVLLMGLSCGTLFYMIFNNILPEISNPRSFKDLFWQVTCVTLGFTALFLL